ncbi:MULTISPECIES: site-specific integrase [Bacillus subtilis group]|uniref:site-specific integrase n=1 Tax=Bacillus subtilis group TaxID=653685 RepID=UPI000472CA56|nr:MULTISPECIES: site-specific integrase [Bacillus subtilis group]HWO97794.1 site-specific integrase [Bacillus sp. (in: firmicutes)]ARC76552.1 transposase [Bacillus licheniformis]ARW52646.1 Integrase [Bacillus licheniformis]AXF87340.1 site-specific integrase [Bacillus licheniformis]MEC1810987.1 site-specific integrase [Bacillus licheniformis]
MKGSFRRRGCKCKKKRCTCGAKWYYRYDIVDPTTGKRKQKEVGGFRTKAEAEEKAKRIQYELLQGTYIEEKEITFEEFAKEWLIWYENTGKVKVSTIRVRKHEISRLMDYFQYLKMKDITRKQYQEALNDLKARGYAENTIDGAHRTGRMIFKRAIELEVIKTDPTEYAIVPKVQKTVEELEREKELPKYLEKEELAHFLSIIPDHQMDIRDYPIFLTLAYTGMRAGELCALKWSDIDFEEQTISITKTYYNPRNAIKEYELLTPKTKKSKRVIDVTKDVLIELDKLRKAQKEVQMKYRKTYHNEGFVFAQLDEVNAGYPAYVKLIEIRMKRLLKIANLNPSLTPHSLRHTHTSLLAEAGVSLEQIMDRLGHTDDDTTKNIYLHITKPKKKEASHKFSELMRSLL